MNMKVKLEKILWGGEQGIPASVYSLKTRNYLRSSTLLKDSPQVQLLLTYQKIGDQLFENDRYRETPYYRNIIECIEQCGNYFNVEDPKDAVHQVRRYIDHFNGKELPKVHHQSDEQPPLVAPNAFSDLFEVVDGIHRLAIDYVNGVEEVECRISSQQTVTFLQELVIGNKWTPGQKLLYQPIEAPEFGGFTLVRKCSDRLKMMEDFITARGLDLKDKKYIDLGCSYGYFMSKMEQKGMVSYGIDTCPNSIMLGQICYNLPKERLLCLSVENFFELNEEKYEVVSLLSVLHHFLLNKGTITAEELIRGVDKLTGKVLFLDSGQNHEQWFKETLPDWDEEAMVYWLREKTSFDEVVVLGKDEDNIGVYAPNYQRSFIACIRN